MINIGPRSGPSDIDIINNRVGLSIPQPAVKSVEINGLRQHVCRWVSRPAFQRCGSVEISDHGGGLHRRGVELWEKWLHLHGFVLADRAVGKNQRSPVECNLFPNHGCSGGAGVA
jgi:hypothetical protein